MLRERNVAVHETIYTFVELLMEPEYHETQYHQWAPIVLYLYGETVEEIIADETKSVSLLF